jgi:hypothetical protein
MINSLMDTFNRFVYIPASARTMCSSAFIFLLVLCFLLTQALPAHATFASGKKSVIPAEQSNGQSKRGCCCCKPLTCPCDMKKGKTINPISNDCVFAPRSGDKTLEEEYPFTVYVTKSPSSYITLKTDWIFARAPCPQVYLTTLNLLC